MCSYTVKEGNYRGNFPEEDIQKWYDESFSKSEKTATRNKILTALSIYKYQSINALRAKAIVLLADIAKNNRPTRSGVDGLVLEHFHRTGQHKMCFCMLYPMEPPPEPNNFKSVGYDESDLDPQFANAEYQDYLNYHTEEAQIPVIDI